MKKKIVLTAILIILACVLVYKTIPLSVNVNIDSPVALSSLLPVAAGGNSGNISAISAASVSAISGNSASVKPQETETETEMEAPAPQEDKSDGKPSGIPSSKKEVVQKYTDVMNKFKAEKPGYTKKEYQSLPEEYRNFSSIINRFLGFADSYMVSEDDERALVVRDPGSDNIINEIPICGSDKACLLLDYDPQLECVKSAVCEPVGDGTYKITIVLNDELNSEPTDAQTLVPVSAHGSIMQPASRKDIMVEVNKVLDKIKIATLNYFDLNFTECSFSCIYDPNTDRLVSVDDHENIDISANVNIMGGTIEGSARLWCDTKIYDIIW